MEHIFDDIIFDNNYVIIGVSTGPDSMCLLKLLQEKTKNIVICHINHNVREESNSEEEYLRNYAKENNIIFECMKIDNYEENNFENEARKKRYTFYETILKKYNSKTLFLAHHGDDLIETVLMKIVRGSNIEGYAGIKKISKIKDYQIIRPLLAYTKNDIANYNKEHNIKYFIDNTNSDTNYTRNRYRKNILPLLKEEDKDVHKKFINYSNTLLEYDNYIKSLVKIKINDIYNDNTIYIDKLLELDDFLIKNTLYYILNDVYKNENNIITNKHIIGLIKVINNTKPNIIMNMPKGKIIVKEYNKLIIKDSLPNNEDYNIIFDNNLTINNLDFNKIEKTDNDSNYICRLDSDTINFPIYFRNKKDGDYIILKGSNYYKKIKEIFIENKLPIQKRNAYPLLIDNNDNIIWIPGIKKSKFCSKKNEKYDIIIECKEREENYE